MNILLLEPNAILGRTYRQFLRSNNHEVLWVQDAQAAISAIDQRVPDLILLELQLALHNGIEFLYELRSYAEWQGLNVVVLSHIPEKAWLKEILKERLGVKRYLYKSHTNLANLTIAINQVTKISEIA